MTAENNNKPWYRFFDGNRKYDYKSLYNAVSWAERKVPTSTSSEIKIYRLVKRGRAMELDMVVRIISNNPSKSRTVIGLENEQVRLDSTNGSITTIWRDIDVYQEYKDKEEWLSSDSV